MSSFKLFFLRSSNLKDIELVKRIRTPHLPTFEEFQGPLLASLFPLKKKEEEGFVFEVSWVDEDGDVIVMSTQWEWEEAISSCSSWPLRLYIQTKEGRKGEEGFEKKDQESPNQQQQLQEQQQQKEERQQEQQEQQRLQTIQTILNKLILPEQEIPSWLAPAVSLSPNNNKESPFSLSFDPSSNFFPSLLRTRAQDLLIFASCTSDFEKRISLEQQAVVLLRWCLVLCPGEDEVVFEFCCALSRDGEVEEAVRFLDKYLKKEGRGRVEEVQKHPDLKNVRQWKGFGEWVRPYLKQEEKRGKREEVERRKREKEAEEMRKREEMKRREEVRRVEEMRREEERRKREEMRKLEELRKEEEERKREQKRREEMKKREEARRHEELRKREESKKREEMKREKEAKKRQEDFEKRQERKKQEQQEEKKKKEQQIKNRQRKRAPKPIATIEDCEEEDFDIDNFIHINHSRLETPLTPLPSTPHLSPPPSPSPSSLSPFRQAPLEPPIPRPHMEKKEGEKEREEEGLERRWEREVGVLEGLGFGVKDLNLALLEKYQGDLNRVVDHLLGC